MFSQEAMKFISYATGNSKKRIMVVDDECDIIFTIRKVLELSGFEIGIFDDADLALRKFKVGLFDLAILDIKMPRMNGFELYIRMKDIDENIRVIFLSALSDLQNYAVLKNEVYPKWGQRHFVQKPVGNKDLIERVNLVLSI